MLPPLTTVVAPATSKPLRTPMIEAEVALVTSALGLRSSASLSTVRLPVPAMLP